MFEFSHPFVLNDRLLGKIKQPLKKFRLTTLASQSVEWLCMEQKKDSNFHNLLPDLHNHLDEHLNERRL